MVLIAEGTRKLLGNLFEPEALGEPPEDPLMLFLVLYGFWTANWGAFDGDTLREIAGQILALVEKQGMTVLLVMGRYLMGNSLMATGDIAQARAHYDQAVALYNPAEHRPMAMRIGQDSGPFALSWRSWALWMLGFPEAALADAKRALKDAGEFGNAATLMNALMITSTTQILCGNYAAAKAQLDELVTLADEKGSLFFKAMGMTQQGWLLVLTGRASDAVHIIAASHRCMARNGSNPCGARVVSKFGVRLCRTRTIR